MRTLLRLNGWLVSALSVLAVIVIAAMTIGISAEVILRMCSFPSIVGMIERVADRWGVTVDDAPPRQKILPLGEIDRTYGDRLLVIGDAAGLVKPTTGAGIHYSILSGRLAADVAGDANW